MTEEALVTRIRIAPKPSTELWLPSKRKLLSNNIVLDHENVISTVLWIVSKSPSDSHTKTKLRGRSPQANYTDRATAACWRS
jgi:hypothetical protein